MKMKLWFNLLILGLIASNIWAVYDLDVQSARYVQLVSTAVLLLLYILKGKIEKTFLVVLILLVLCDALITNYEDPLFRKLIYLTRITIYFLIISFVLPFLSRLKFNFFTVLISAFIISIDVYLLHDMALYIPNYHQDWIFTILFYALGLSSLALVATCISYLNRYASNRGFLLMLVSICFVLSDVTFYNAYYLDFEIFYYLDKTANIIGIAALISFAEKWVNTHKRRISSEV